MSARATKPTAAVHSRGHGARPMRADALRNRERIVAAAIEAFAQEGLDVGVAEIARRAEVGPGTLFRNFPTKEDLILAVFEERVKEAIAVAQASLDMEDAGAAFERFHFELAGLQMRDVGFFHAIRQRMFEHPVMRERKDQILKLVAQILERAQSAGAVRMDVTLDDLKFMMMSLTQADIPAGEMPPDIHARHLRILLDGLKPSGAGPMPGGLPQ